MFDRIEFENGLNAYLVFDDITSENPKMDVIIPNFENIDEDTVVHSLEHIVADPNINPFNINTYAIEDAYDKLADEEEAQWLEDEGIPRNIKTLFETREINPNGFKDLSKRLDPNEPIRLYAVDSEDPSYWFGSVNLSDPEVARYVVNHNVGYLLTKLVMKNKSIVLRLLISPKFEIKQFEDGTFGMYVKSSENSIEFKPYKIKRSKKKC